MQKLNSKIDQKENQIIFQVNNKIYPIKVLYKTCYVFIDRFYIYLDSFKKSETTIFLKGKEKKTKKQLEIFKGEFLNELLNSHLREELSRKNWKILEYIVGGAITASLERPKETKRKQERDIEKEIASLKRELESAVEEDYVSDPLGISRPYEKQYKKRE